MMLTLEQPFVSHLAVRIADINYGNHLGHDRLISLLHQARVEALAAIGASELDFFGTALILARLETDYRAQAFLHDTLDIAVWLGEMRASRFVLHYRVSRRDSDRETLIAEAQTVMVCFDYQRQRSTAVPDMFRENYRHE
ncbi:MAG: thioesterase family protein [Cardiobacteriaceae bacterium]|nr:thioesterase family protein [Cardiobacteriaceae bacterium]